MKSQKFLSTLLIGLLLLVTVAGAGRGAVNAQSAATPAATMAVTTAFDIKPVLEKFFANVPDGFYGISPTDALKALSAEPKPFVLDVREPKELTDGGFVEGAVNIPIRTLTQNLDKLPAQDAPIIVYCAIGHRGAQALLTLRLLGYTNVKSISGGFNAWKTNKLPVATGTPVAPTAGKAPEVDKDLFAFLDRYVTSLPDGFYGISPVDTLKALSAEPKPFLVDVREPKELTDNGYIEGQTNIPFRTLLKSLDKFPADKSAAMIVYCAIGHRGGMAMMTLRLLGYTNVKSISGGFNGWKAASLPIVKPASATGVATVAATAAK